MATYKPIQKRLLIHDIEYKEKLKTGAFGDEYGLTYTVSNVRVEPGEKFKRQGENEAITANHLVFIDMFYSKPIPDIKPNDLIIFKDKEMKVVTVEELYSADRLHHLEVWCLG